MSGGWFAPDHAGLADFWRVYERHADAIADERLRPALLRAAAGDWDGYERELRARGGDQARQGVPVADWYDLMGALERRMIPHLLGAGDEARVAAALSAMHSFAARTMAVIAEAYVAAKEELAHEQRRLAERNEERYQMLFDNGPVPMWVYDADTLRFLAVNRAAVAQYGYGEEEFLAMTIEDIRFPEDLPRLRAERRAPRRPTKDLGEWRHRKKDGSAISVELRLETFIFLGRRAHLIVAHDVTERRRTARAIKESEERYRSLVAATASVVWSADRDGRFAAPQAGWEAYTGFAFEDQRGLGWLDAVVAEDRERLTEAWARAVAGCQKLDEETRLRHAATASYRWCELRAVPLLDEAGRAREWIGTVTDVDDEKKAIEPGRFFALTLDLLCIAGADGHFKRLNPAFAALGWSEAELLGRPFLELVHPDDREATATAVARLARGQTTVHLENRYRCKDGSYRTLLWSAASDLSGLIFAAARDVTEPKRVEAERIELNRLLVERNEALERASRAKSDFLAMMSHELRTPLNSIIGFSEVLLDGKFGALGERQARYLNNVLTSGRHLLGLINDLLDLSKIEAGRLEVVPRACDVAALATEALATLQPLADARRVQLALDPAQAPHVHADPARLKQVLYNLLSNAIKFTPAGGRVQVSATHLSPLGRVRIAVRDTGPGIAGADLQRLFRPFSQLDNGRDRGGTGLGLALTRQLVELMGGRVGVESSLGAGSTFFVELPEHTGATVHPGAPALDEPEAPLVLIVDDDAAARELLLLTLSAHGYGTRTAASGDEALAMTRELLPDVITLDIQLPTIDGWDVLRLLKSDRETAAIPVVMISVSNDRAKAFSLGAVEHLVKPVAREELLAVLARRGFTPRREGRAVEVLAVDDDAAQLDLIRAALEPHGFRVRTETSGRRGVLAALEQPADLLLLDLVMPDMSGIEVVAALRSDERTRALPILLLTAHELSAADRARLNGDVQAVLAKGDARLENLLGEIERVLRRR